jgi:NAD(P)-dependent dehydrogenase (short-subunit alcohol dehydrogenase family)
MKLASRDGGYAGLRVVAYEFETPPAIAADEDDADEWLVVRGGVRLGDNREWAFTGPYLTISEARHLGAWLVAAIGPVRRVGKPDDVAETITYLAGAGFVTGSVLECTGGFNLTAAALPQ